MKYKIESKYYEIKVADKEAAQISTPDVLFDCLKDDFSPVNENMHLIILNIENKIIDKILIAKGSYNTMALQPVDIFRPILLTAGNRFVLAHNHPSGNTQPSCEDINFTKKINKSCKLMGVEMLDHIIYTNNDLYSFKKNGLL